MASLEPSVHLRRARRPTELLILLDDDHTTGPASKEQVQAEGIFLTHIEALREVNPGWPPASEACQSVRTRPPPFLTASGLGAMFPTWRNGERREQQHVFDASSSCGWCWPAWWV